MDKYQIELRIYIYNFVQMLHFAITMFYPYYDTLLFIYMFIIAH